MAQANPHYTESLRNLMEMLGKLPGVGARSAERMAFHLLKGPSEQALALAEAIRAVREQVRHCAICFNLTERRDREPTGAADGAGSAAGEAICSICADAARDHGVICVVEQPKDLLQLESAGVFRGVYHVLLGRIAPLENLTPSELTIPQLLDRLKGQGDQAVREVILATNPTMEGDGTALHIQQEIGFVAPHINVTRLARGLPAGAQIEYSNRAILADAINGRTRA